MEAVDRYVFVYLDVILIYSQTVDEHVTHVRRVLQLLLENHLFVKLEKSVFNARTISFWDLSSPTMSCAWTPARCSKFVRNFSAVAAPLIVLTRKMSGRFCWSTEAQQAFEELKRCLIKAPILKIPDAELPFVIGVDASEQNRANDVGNRELLVVKLVLEEWRHWLEGAKHPFLVWTDHKNLAYIEQAKRLNPCQARWGLFFARFDFTLSYRAGTKNIKPVALSRQWESSLPSAPPSSTDHPPKGVHHSANPVVD
ncbi:hypothetical protein P4O66_009441 [Electrophorus voltai]|uniref:Reverse transcriptase RNase H-like domain-containing protein n=1 Tax=Electrophorus voltai TaxID=2609070 RepID=A0AAD9DWD2_9TELE|nr:hypothetical protein P4O66_009441 [Electrophorus voltai]